MKRCTRCGEEKPVSEFAWKSESKGWRMSYCKQCVRARSRAHYTENRATYLSRNKLTKRDLRTARLLLLLEYFVEHPCVDCGETDPLVLDFDHLRDKEFTIGEELISRSWDAVTAEIEKCEVVCANCHRRRTSARGGFLRVTLQESD